MPKLKRILIYPDGVTEKQVYPAWWKPNANTVLYYPFKEDKLDKVWSSSIGATWTKETLWYTFSSSWVMDITNPSTECRFISVWIKYNSGNWQYVQWPYTYIWYVVYNFSHTNSVWNKRFQYSSSATSWNARRPNSDTVNITSWTWYHMAYWTDGTKVYAYVNGVKVWETTITPWLATPSGMSIGNAINETLSEFIWENRVWTAEEVLNYYNTTKSNYGL